MNTVADHLRYAQHWLWGSRCLLCTQRTLKAQTACHDCLTSLASHAAKHGAQPQSPDGIDSLWSLSCYTAPFSAVVQTFKAHQPALARPLAELLLQLQPTLCTQWGQHASKGLIVPVAPFASRLRMRGFSPTAALASALSKRLGQPLMRDALHRRGQALAQRGQSRAVRLSQLQGSFCIPKRTQAALQSVQRLLLVDDVLTTGATLATVAQVFRQAGVATIDACVLAWAPGTSAASLPLPG